MDAPEAEEEESDPQELLHRVYGYLCQQMTDSRQALDVNDAAEQLFAWAEQNDMSERYVII